MYLIGTQKWVTEVHFSFIPCAGLWCHSGGSARLQGPFWCKYQNDTILWQEEVFTFPRLFCMESMWNEDGMINSTWIPHGSTWIPLDSIWNAGISTLDSMEQIHFHEISAGIPEKQPYLITKNSGDIENRTPASTKYHVISQMSMHCVTI